MQVEFEADAQAQVAQNRELVSWTAQALQLGERVRKQLVRVTLLGEVADSLVDVRWAELERVHGLLAVEPVGDLRVEEDLCRLEREIDVVLFE